MPARSAVPFRGILSFMGAMIGAGVFALPAAMNIVGILAGSILYWTLAFVVLAVHLLYAEVMLARADMKGRRLPGQVGLLFGPWMRRLAFVTQPLHIMGACLIYLILGGEFLAVIGESLGIVVPLLVWQILFWIGGALTLFYGVKIVIRVESFLTRALIVLMLALVVAYATVADGTRFLVWNPEMILAPLGVFVFATFGLNFIPEIVEMSNRRRATTLLSVGIGSLVAAFLMWLFAVFAAAADPGIHGPADLIRALPSWIAWAIPVVGFLAVAEAFLTQTQDLRATFEYDAKTRAFTSAAIAVGVPMLLLLLVTRDFLSTVSFVGSVFSSINAIFIGLMAMKLRIAPFIAASVTAIFLFVLAWGILSVIV